jgi:hypothetical protein
MSTERLSTEKNRQWFLIHVINQDYDSDFFHRFLLEYDCNLVLQEDPENIFDTPETFDSSWLFWSPIIPRVGDTYQFPGFQMKVDRVFLYMDVFSSSGILPSNKTAAGIMVSKETREYLI